MMGGFSLALELPSKGDEYSDDADAMHEAIGQALADAIEAAKSGDHKEAGRLFCMALEAKGEY